MKTINLGEPATIEFTVKEGGVAKNISEATVVELKFSRGETEKIVAAAHKTDGTDGVIRYVVTATDLNAVGVWKVSARITTAGGVFGADPEKILVQRW